MGGGIQPLAGSPVPPHPSPRIKNGSAVVGGAGLAAGGQPGACGGCAVGGGVAQALARPQVWWGFDVLEAPFSLLMTNLLRSAHFQAGYRL